jgi:hypothetical protein
MQEIVGYTIPIYAGKWLTDKVSINARCAVANVCTASLLRTWRTRNWNSDASPSCIRDIVISLTFLLVRVSATFVIVSNSQHLHTSPFRLRNASPSSRISMNSQQVLCVAGLRDVIVCVSHFGGTQNWTSCHSQTLDAPTFFKSTSFPHYNRTHSFRYSYMSTSHKLHP